MTFVHPRVGAVLNIFEKSKWMMFKGAKFASASSSIADRFLLQFPIFSFSVSHHRVNFVHLKIKASGKEEKRICLETFEKHNTATSCWNAKLDSPML